jgi:hypothetical protein
LGGLHRQEVGREQQVEQLQENPGADFMKPFWPKFTDKAYFGQI